MSEIGQAILSSTCLFLVLLLVLWFIYFTSELRQKTRTPQRRQMYAGSRQRPSLSPGEPTIYVSPSNLPPPPKYEALAPPSYEEVVGVHYPSYQPQGQPITQPITAALAQSTSNATDNVICNNVVPHNVNEAPTTTVVTVTADERRTSVRVATS